MKKVAAGSGDGGKGSMPYEPTLQERVKYGVWRGNLEEIDSQLSWRCHYCHTQVGARPKGWRVTTPAQDGVGWVAICANCNMPTLVDEIGRPLMSAAPFESVTKLPVDIEYVFDEALKAFSFGGFSAVVLLCRKLIMHIAFELGRDHFEAVTNRDKGRTPGFAEYVTWLSENHHIPPGGKWWVDKIVNRGNDENHQLVIATGEDATEILRFARMLLIFVYEMQPPESERGPFQRTNRV